MEENIRQHLKDLLIQIDQNPMMPTLDYLLVFTALPERIRR